mmetsp:Transcript_1218/g.4731  ORF Transcript_1218/g.4731 Transcript_1218/m.4731 type:complete len:248 (-) Transcript_1218:662-1405(-)
MPCGWTCEWPWACGCGGGDTCIIGCEKCCGPRCCGGAPSGSPDMAMCIGVDTEAEEWLESEAGVGRDPLAASRAGCECGVDADADGGAGPAAAGVHMGKYRCCPWCWPKPGTVPGSGWLVPGVHPSPAWAHTGRPPGMPGSAVPGVGEWPVGVGGWSRGAAGWSRAPSRAAAAAASARNSSADACGSGAHREAAEAAGWALIWVGETSPDSKDGLPVADGRIWALDSDIRGQLSDWGRVSVARGACR